MSASEICAFGGIGIWPQTPTPPFFTLSASLASADMRLRPRLAASTLAFLAGAPRVGLALLLAVVVEGMGGLLLAKKGGTLA